MSQLLWFCATPEIWQLRSLNHVLVIFSPQNHLAILGPWHFHINFTITLSNYMNWICGFDWNFPKSIRNFGGKSILKILNLPNQVHGTSLYVFISSFIFLKTALQFSVYNCKFLIKFVLKFHMCYIFNHFFHFIFHFFSGYICTIKFCFSFF